MVLLPLLGLLAGAGIAAALFQALAGDGPGSPAVAADQETQTGTTVTIDAADYIGRPLEEVVDELTALGLDVERRQVPTDDAVPGSVTDVAPDGVLQQEDTVVVSYAVAPGSRRTSEDGTAVTGAAIEPEADTSTAATPTEPAPTTDAATDGDTTELPGEPVDTSVVTEPTDAATPTESTPTDTTTTETTTTGTTTSGSSSGPGDDVNTVDGSSTVDSDDD
jgi:serine/threonine-protein kinase